MTVLTADIRGLPAGTTSPYLTADIDAGGSHNFGTHDSDSSLEHAGALVSNLPVSAAELILSGDRRRSYIDDFYYRIHIIPNPISLGNLLANKTLAVAVWNAYFDPKNLSDLTVPTDFGVTMTPPAGETVPFVMNPLREAIFTLSAALAGPPVIDTTITFVIGGVTVQVPVTGKRVVVFPFPPNWSGPYDETFEYNSWVLTAADGSEQTGSNWGNHARRQFGYTILVAGKQMQRLENLLFAWQQRLFGVPHWAEKSKLLSASVVGATTISLDTTDRSYEAGGFAILYLDPDNYEAFSIEETTSTTLKATSALQRAWPQGTRVYPISLALIAETSGGTYQTDNKIVMPVNFSCEPSQSPENTSVGDATPMYRGEELYLGRLNWASPLAFSVRGDRKALDYKTGIFNTYSHSGFSGTTRKHNWQVRSRAESRALRAWIGRREGMARPVYMPTGNSDLTLVSPIVSASNVIEVASNDYGSFVNASPAKRDIIILLRDGSYFARRITGATVVSNAVTRLAIDSPIPQSINVAQIKRISMLGFYRLAGNSTTIRWITDEIGTMEANIMTKVTP